MLGFTLRIYHAVLLKRRTSPATDRDLVLTVQPNLRYDTETLLHATETVVIGCIDGQKPEAIGNADILR